MFALAFKDHFSLMRQLPALQWDAQVHSPALHNRPLCLFEGFLQVTEHRDLHLLHMVLAPTSLPRLGTLLLQLLLMVHPTQLDFCPFQCFLGLFIPTNGSVSPVSAIGLSPAYRLWCQELTMTSTTFQKILTHLTCLVSVNVGSHACGIFKKTSCHL